MSNAKTMIGRVRKRVPRLGFGFIVTDENDEEIFFHARNIKGHREGDDLPQVGAVVQFRLVVQHIPGKRNRAVDVEVL